MAHENTDVVYADLGCQRCGYQPGSDGPDRCTCGDQREVAELDAVQLVLDLEDEKPNGPQMVRACPKCGLPPSDQKEERCKDCGLHFVQMTRSEQDKKIGPLSF